MKSLPKFLARGSPVCQLLPETLESLITAQIVENPESTYYDSHYRGARGNNSMGPDDIKRLRNSLSWLKRPRETLHAERTKSRFHFTVLHLGTGAGIC
jgi:hypothetical protein